MSNIYSGNAFIPTRDNFVSNKNFPKHSKSSVGIQDKIIFAQKEATRQRHLQRLQDLLQRGHCINGLMSSYASEYKEEFPELEIDFDKTKSSVEEDEDPLSYVVAKFPILVDAVKKLEKVHELQKSQIEQINDLLNHTSKPPEESNPKPQIQQIPKNNPKKSPQIKKVEKSFKPNKTFPEVKKEKNKSTKEKAPTQRQLKLLQMIQVNQSIIPNSRSCASAKKRRKTQIDLIPNLEDQMNALDEENINLPSISDKKYFNWRQTSEEEFEHSFEADSERFDESDWKPSNKNQKLNEIIREMKRGLKSHLKNVDRIH